MCISRSTIAEQLGSYRCRTLRAISTSSSKDAGFDPLIQHLKSKIRAQRENDLAEIPVLRTASSSTSDEKIKAIIKNLAGRGQSRPRKMETLANTINSLFTKKLAESELKALVKELQERKFIVLSQGNVSYKLPQPF
jgi:hypothetical protein